MDSVQKLTEGVSLVLQIGKARRLALEGKEYDEHRDGFKGLNKLKTQPAALERAPDSHTQRADAPAVYNAKGSLRTVTEEASLDVRR